MIFAAIIDYIRGRLAKRRKYRRLVTEIEALSQRDLIDLGADRGAMLREVRREIYG
jgi:uncharacterized protein YjiS (DUF1127 family)